LQLSRNECAECLLGKGARPTANTLNIAVRTCSTFMVESMVNAKAKPTARTAEYALETDSFERFVLALKAGAMFTQNAERLLQFHIDRLQRKVHYEKLMGPKATHEEKESLQNYQSVLQQRKVQAMSPILCQARRVDGNDSPQLLVEVLKRICQYTTDANFSKSDFQEIVHQYFWNDSVRKTERIRQQHQQINQCLQQLQGLWAQEDRPRCDAKYSSEHGRKTLWLRILFAPHSHEQCNQLKALFKEHGFTVATETRLCQKMKNAQIIAVRRQPALKIKFNSAFEDSHSVQEKLSAIAEAMRPNAAASPAVSHLARNR